jgi:hypothetical protein
MEVLFTKLFKVDREKNLSEKENFKNQDHVDNYIINLLGAMENETGVRDYCMDENSITMESYLDNLNNQEDTEDICLNISKRLLAKEIDAQKKYGHLGDIQKGMLIISLLQMTDTERKVIISKADYDRFIEEISGELKDGLPMKKKIYKSFTANFSINGDDSYKLGKVIAYDTYGKVSEYWWKHFLELEVVVSDRENTKRAFDAIEKKILIPIKKNHKEDYLYLWNATIAYFRRGGDFSMGYYADEIVGKYVPVDGNLKPRELQKKCNALLESEQFDNTFELVPSEVRKRFKSILDLTPEISLLLKNDIANLNTTIRPKEDENGKYIMIKSDAGFEYASMKLQENNE